MRDVPVVHRRVAFRLEMRTGFLARIGAEGDGCVGRAESRGADRGNGPMKLLGEEREADDIAGLALVGAHPQRGVALEMLDRLVALAHGERDVAHGDVVLQVDKSLAAPVSRGNAPERAQSPGRNGLGVRCGIRSGSTKTSLRRRVETGTMTVRQRAAHIGASVHAACGHDRQRRALGHERGQRFIVAQAPACLGKQMHRGIPAARHANQVAVDARAASAGKGFDVDRRHALAPVRGSHHRA